VKQSELPIKTRRSIPKDETAKNAQLLIRAGFINKEMAGVYSYLPLGILVLRKIENIIREEMNAIGGREIFLTSLQDPKIWQKTERWSDKTVDIWFKTKLKNGAELGLANTHEEEIANFMTHHIHSYRDLPAYLYQIQTKFRNETRSKSGLIRAREFLMKDLYSFSRDEKELDKFFDKCAGAYRKIFKRVGIADRTYLTFASGGSFSKYSYEFQTLAEAGEDTIYLDEKNKIAINKEVYRPEVVRDLGLEKKKLAVRKAIEVGNLFKLGTKYSTALGLFYLDERGQKRPVVMGSYGIGLGRLMAAVVEVLADERGLVWPESIAPFRTHLIELRGGLGRDLYQKLSREGVTVLYDDRKVTAGEKFNDADLIGIPWRLTVSEKTVKKIEVKKRSSKQINLLTYGELVKKLL